MKDTHLYGIERVEHGLVQLEDSYPNIRADLQRLLILLRVRGFGVGERLDPADQDLGDVSWTNIHSAGSGSQGRNAGVLVYEIWRDENATEIQLIEVYPGTLWHGWSWKEKRAEVRKLV